MILRCVPAARISAADNAFGASLWQLAEVKIHQFRWLSLSETDHGLTGAQGRDKRPDFDRLCKDAARRQFDIAVAWSVERALARGPSRVRAVPRPCDDWLATGAAVQFRAAQ